MVYLIFHKLSSVVHGAVHYTGLVTMFCGHDVMTDCDGQDIIVLRADTGLTKSRL